MHAGPATGTAPVIDVDLRLTVRDATRGFDLAVRFASDDPVLALYGASGAGKSLTLQAIAGLQQPCAGHVRIAGRTLYDSAAGIELPAEDRRIGVLFQDYALFPHLDVRQNVAFGLTRWHRRRLSRADALRVDGLLSAFGLESLSKARPAALSGGQRQRVALARALACEPSLLLLDEPFAALNPQWRQELRQELAAVRARWHIPMLMVTHDVDDVLALADRACLIDRGQVVREVDLRSGAPVEHLWRELVPARARPAADGPALALRRLLGAPPRTA